MHFCGGRQFGISNILISNLTVDIRNYLTICLENISPLKSLATWIFSKKCCHDIMLFRQGAFLASFPYLMITPRLFWYSNYIRWKCWGVCLYCIGPNTRTTRGPSGLRWIVRKTNKRGNGSWKRAGSLHSRSPVSMSNSDGVQIGSLLIFRLCWKLTSLINKSDPFDLFGRRAIN